MSPRFHPHLKTRQQETSAQGYLARAYEAASNQEWAKAKYWFDRAIKTEERCATALGEVGVTACEAATNAAINQVEVYRRKQKELSTTIPSDCLI